MRPSSCRELNDVRTEGFRRTRLEEEDGSGTTDTQLELLHGVPFGESRSESTILLQDTTKGS